VSGGGRQPDGVYGVSGMRTENAVSLPPSLLYGKENHDDGWRRQTTRALLQREVRDVPARQREARLPVVALATLGSYR
jgi:hypothetical protein